MIAYRVEIWCDGCGIHFGTGTPHEDVTQSGRYVQTLVECAQASGWTPAGAAHFCPSCQIQRAKGPIVDALALANPKPGESS